MRSEPQNPGWPALFRAAAFRFAAWESGWRANALAALFLLALTGVALGTTLFSRELVFSNVDRDIALQFVHWRKFGFDGLRAGHLALWNPHIYGGAPFFGGFQSALLYPPNGLYLCLPLGVAINVGIALHVFLTGFGMFLWMRERGLHPAAALFAGVICMFSGPVFPHVYAGHLPNLCAMAWGPFIFLAIDGWLRCRTPGWLLLGAAGVAMQILAGHPQYVFYTGVAAGLYAALQLAVARDRLRALAGLAAFPLAGAALSAVQLLEGFHAAGESVRNHGTTLAFAAKFGFPPENLLTALVPNFFGSLSTHHYWGRWQLWEMGVFFGVTGLVMAVHGLARGPRFAVWSGAAVAGALLLMAFGPYTPLFHLLYRFAPGFDHFRGWSKFTYPAMLLAVMLAATGFDVLLRGGIGSAWGGRLVLGLGLGGGALALWESQAVAGGSADALAPWRFCLRLLSNSQERLHVGAANLDGPVYIAAMANQALRQSEFAALTLVVLGVLLLLARRHAWVLTGVLVLAVIEMAGYARSCLDHFPLQAVFATPEARFLSAHASEDFRVNDVNNPNLAMSVGGYALWGYDPGVLRRYAEWIAVSQGLDPDAAAETVNFSRTPAVFTSLLRLRSMIPGGLTEANGAQPGGADRSIVPPAARLMLVPRARVIPGRKEELGAIFDAGFDPAREVLLETAPVPAPTGVAVAGRVRLVAETTDSLTIEADLAAPAVLLVTDAYSDGWHARSLLPARGTGAQTQYQVLPADYCLRGIPLDRGHHEILLEYRPTAYVVGKWVSLAAGFLYLSGVVVWWARRPFRTKRGACDPPPPVYLAGVSDATW